MKRVLFSAIALMTVALPLMAQPSRADGVCGLPLATVEQVGTTASGSHRLNDVVAQAFLDKFNNTGPLTRYQAPVWIIDRPEDNVLEIIATIDGRGCAFVALGQLRNVMLKMIYGDEA